MSKGQAKAKPNGRGRLLVIGANEDPDDDDLLILPRLAEMAGGRKARLLVCAAPTTHATETLRDYRKALEAIGVADLIECAMDTCEAANEPAALDALEAARASSSPAATSSG